MSPSGRTSVRSCNGATCHDRRGRVSTPRRPGLARWSRHECALPHCGSSTLGLAPCHAAQQDRVHHREGGTCQVLVDGWLPCLALGLHASDVEARGGERQGKMLRDGERPRLPPFRRTDRRGALPVGACVCHDDMVRWPSVQILCGGAWEPPCQRDPPSRNRYVVGVGVAVAGPAGVTAVGAVGVGVSSAVWVGAGVIVGDGVAVGVRVIGVPM